MQHLFADGCGLDVGERLYARNTAASVRKRNNTSNAAGLEAAWSTFREQGIDVKAEVDRMFHSIMESIEHKEADVVFDHRKDGGDPFVFTPFVLDENTDSRIAAARALMKHSSLSLQRRTTFGSGRKGMSEKVRKIDAPGPGQYHPDDERQPFSSRSSQRCESSGGRSSSSAARLGSECSGRVQTPRAKGFSFGTGNRTTLEGLIPTNRAKQLAAAPGPGEYKVPGAFEPSQTKGRKGTFGLAPRSVDKADTTPGPGSYALDEKKLAPERPPLGVTAFLTSSPRMPDPKPVTPGPGTYHQVERGQSPPPLRETPMFSFPRAEAKGPESCTPGPGTYDTTTTSRRDTNTKGVIPQAGRDDGVWGGKKKLEEPSPGPGEYTAADELHGAIGVTLKFRHEQRASSIPGPGQYDFLAHEEPSGPKWSMPPRRPAPEAEVLPGPADYANDGLGTQNGPRVVFGHAKRDTHEEIAGKVELPGPGEYAVTYDAVEPKVAKNVVFGTGTQRPAGTLGEARDTVPGPGAYDPEDPMPSGRSVAASTAPRFMPSPTDVPGPGYYDTLAAALVESKRSTSVVVGQAPRNTSANFVAARATDVGPGAYDLPALDAGRQHTIGMPLPTTAEPADPERGPGAYAVPLSTLGDAPKAAIGAAARFVAPQEEVAARAVPGPGAYEPHDVVAAKAAVFGTSSKEPELPVGSGLGPGTYDPQELHVAGHATIFGSSARFNRERENSPHPVPGPGAYDSELPPSGPAILFGTGAGHDADIRVTDEPGPGTYETALPTSTSAAVFGTSKQRNDIVVREASQMPGPSDYAPQIVSPHIPTAYINSRPVEARTDDAPGPGMYYTQLGDASPSAFFGSAPARTAGTAEGDVPGPGAYYVQQPDATVSVAFPTASRFMQSSDADATPGPGSYDPPRAQSVGIGIGTAPRPTMAGSAVPGPGAYTPVLPPDAPAVSINSAPRPFERPSDAPGPGAYTPQPVQPAVHSVVFTGRPAEGRDSAMPGPGAYDFLAELGLRGPHISFPQAPRYRQDGKEALPGPGAYYVALPDTSPQVHFLTAPRTTDLAANGDVPGPGQYSPVPVPQHPGYSFPQASMRPLIAHDAPGPGAYDVSVRADAPAYSFGQAPQHATAVAGSVPGPGAYDYSYPRDAPAFSFGKLTREQLAAATAQDTPGPGAYPTAPSLAGPAFSVGTAPRQGIAPSSITPGPGAYAVHNTDARGDPAYSVPKAPRFPNDGAGDLPGPGEYQLPAPGANMLGAFIGTALRQGPSAASEAPGPGQYDVHAPREAQTFSLGTNAPRFPDSMRNSDVPGPASYDPYQSEAHGKGAATVGTAPRFPLPQNVEVPGPGAYSVRMGPEGRYVSFGVAPRAGDDELRRQAQLPGPGHYDPMLYAAEGPAFTFGGKRLDPQRNDGDLPGPGQYHTDTAFGLDARAAMIGPLPTIDPDAAFARKANAVPGPAAYMLPDTLDRRAVPFGTAVRDPVAGDDRDQIPGPGAYVTGGVGMFDGPKYSIPQEARDGGMGVAAHDAPGPGAYDGGRAQDRLLKSVPVYSFPQAARDDDAEDRRGYPSVGPGAYNLGVPPHAGPAYSFPQSEAFMNGGQGRAVSEIPGPGMYYAPSEWGNRGPTIGGKWPAQHTASEVPGPGHYRVHDFDPYARDRAICVDFSKGGERPCNVKVENVFSDMPGPGQYYSGALQFGDGRGVTILERQHQPFVERTPGPPDYHHPAQRHPFFDPLSH